LEVEQQAMTEEANAEDARNSGPPATSKSKDSDLFRHVYDESNTDPEYVYWKKYHAELKALALEHKVDTSKARSRSLEEHNHLVSTFLTKAFSPDEPTNSTVDSTVAAMNGGVDAAVNVGKCLQAITSIAAPKFCWKDGGRNHQIPGGCPSGWRRDMAECFQVCRAGYYYVGGGTCWQYCRNGYHDHGATCYKNFFNWYFKSHYWTSRKTNFDGSIPCDENQYKSGAMCYLDCANPPPGSSAADKTSMVNCFGYDSCGNDGDGCGAAIMEIVLEVAMTVASIAVLVATWGTAAPATAAGTAVLRRMGAQGAKAVAKYSARSAFRTGVQSFAKKVAKNAAENFAGNAMGNAIKAFCEVYAKSYYEKLTGNPQEFDPAKLDFTGTVATYQACTPPKSDASDTGCAKAIVSQISMVDPTGLLGLAAALMHDQCGMGGHSHRPHHHHPHSPHSHHPHTPHHHNPVHWHWPHHHRPKATMDALEYKAAKIQHAGTSTDVSDAEVSRLTKDKYHSCKQVLELGLCDHELAQAACTSSCKQE
jgi:hypothetical protein